MNPDLVAARREGKALHRALRSGERDVAQRVSQRAPQERGTGSDNRVASKSKLTALTAGLQKVSAQLEASKPAPQVVNNRHWKAPTISAKPVGVGAASQRSIPTGERSSSLMHIATTERDSLSPPTKNRKRFSNFNESPVNHCASKMPNDSAQFAACSLLIIFPS